MKLHVLVIFSASAICALLSGCGGGEQASSSATSSLATNIPSATARAGITLYAQLAPGKSDGSLLFYEVNSSATAFVPASDAKVQASLADIKAGTAKIGDLAQGYNISTARVTDVILLKVVPTADGHLSVEANLTTAIVDIDRSIPGNAVAYAITLVTQLPSMGAPGISDADLPQSLQNALANNVIDSLTASLVSVFFVRRL